MNLAFKTVSLILFSVVPYVFFLNGEFVFDDLEAVVKNKDLNLEESPWKVFQNDFWGTDIKSKLSHKSYRPLTVLSFRLNKYFDGGVLVPKNFKIFNLFLHCIVTLLFYKFVHCIYKYRRKNDSVWNDVPFLSTSLFAVHSIHVEAVSGIVGRADLLATLFFLLSIISYDLSVELDSEIVTLSTRRILICSLYFVLSITFAILATLSKETGITVLCICGIYDLLLIQKLNISDIKEIIKYLFRKNKNNQEFEKNNFFIFILRISFLFISFVTILYMRFAVMNFEGPQFQAIDNPSAFNESRTIRIITYNYIYFLNTLLMIWPQWLCFDWSMGCVPLLEGFFDYRIVFVILFWSFVAFVIFKMCSDTICNVQKRCLAMIFSLIVITFLPASNIIMPVGFVVAERILYITSAGFCILISQGFTNLLINTEIKFHKVIKIGFILLICIMSARSMKRSKEWLNENSLYFSGIEVCPLNAKVHYNIAKNAGDFDNFSLAEKEYEEAIRLHPGYYHAMNNLANLLKDQKRFSEAEIHLRNALKLKEDFPAAWMNLGVVLANLKQLSESESAYKKALMYRKNYADCHYNLGNLYLDQNKNDLALKSWSKATELNPKHVLAWSNTFALLDNTGRIDEALKLAPKVLSILSHIPAIHFNLGNIFGKSGDFLTAEKHFKKAIDLKIENIPAVYYANLGVLYHRWKKKRSAVHMYEKALSINPNMKSAQDNLRKLMN